MAMGLAESRESIHRRFAFAPGRGRVYRRSKAILYGPCRPQHTHASDTPRRVTSRVILRTRVAQLELRPTQCSQSPNAYHCAARPPSCPTTPTTAPASHQPRVRRGFGLRIWAIDLHADWFVCVTWSHTRLVLFKTFWFSSTSDCTHRNQGPVLRRRAPASPRGSTAPPSPCREYSLGTCASGPLARPLAILSVRPCARRPSSACHQPPRPLGWSAAEEGGNRGRPP